MARHLNRFLRPCSGVWNHTERGGILGWGRSKSGMQISAPSTVVGLSLDKACFFPKKSWCFKNYSKFPIDICNSDPSILISLEISANKKQEVKLEKAKINSYYFQFCTVEFDTPSFKQAQKLTGLSKNDAVSFYKK